VSDENDNLEEATPNEELQDPLAGERLAEARREQQIAVIEIAKELHLDEYKVRALERNDFDVIGAPVFAKGHLRKYAQLVRVDEADVMADYYQLNRSAGAPPVISTRPRPRQVMSPGPWIGVIAVVLVAATAYWWFAAREATSEPPVTGVIAPLPQESLPADEQQTDIADEADDVVTDEAAVSVEAEPTNEVVAATDDSAMRLSISYSGDCWTEITDASGRRLFFELGKAGRTVNLSGEAPFNVLFGDAENVSIEVNGRSFEIPAADRRGRTARLTIAGS
jgi:cytoskeleton protein RodZ